MAYFVVMGMFALAQSAVGARFTQGQPAFLLAVGVFGPLLALGLIWLQNYVYGAPLLVAALLPTAWFVSYFFFIHENSANVFAVSGNGSDAYLVATVGIVATALITIGVSCWLWYQVSPEFRNAVDRFVRPNAAEN